MRLLLFILLNILLSPLIILGLIVYFYRLRRHSIPYRISGTANEPYAVRLLMHLAGTREDAVAYALSGHLPVYSKFVHFSLVKVWHFVLITTGFKGSFFSYPGPRPSNLATAMNHRTAFFDGVIKGALTRRDNPIKQFVVLGAGFDTRCYNFPESVDLKCFEVDTEPTLKAKLKSLKSAGIAHDHVNFVETDFNQQTWFDALIKTGFSVDLTTLILWEGVTMYLSEDSVLDTLKLASRLPTGSEIAFDYFSGELINQEPPYEKLGARMAKSAITVYEEELKYGISTRKPAREELENILRDCGLKVSLFEHTQTEDPPEIPLYCFALAKTY